MIPAHLDAAGIEKTVSFLRASKKLLFITGAGLSADSDLPTYRGVGGLYDRDNTEEGLPIETMLSGTMMATRPELTWKYLYEIEKACRGKTFNRGHQVIAEMEAHFKKVWVLTQNVDGFHHRAGSRAVIDIHGSLHELCCTGCQRSSRRQDYRDLPIPPHCSDCGAMLRPNVVLFGEALPYDKVAQLNRILLEGVDLVFSVGTSSLFPYIVEPVVEAKRYGIPTVEINPGHTDISQMVDVHLASKAAETLDAIWELYRARDDGKQG